MYIQTFIKIAWKIQHNLHLYKTIIRSLISNLHFFTYLWKYWCKHTPFLALDKKHLLIEVFKITRLCTCFKKDCRSYASFEPYGQIFWHTRVKSSMISCLYTTFISSWSYKKNTIFFKVKQNLIKSACNNVNI